MKKLTIANCNQKLILLLLLSYWIHICKEILICGLYVIHLIFN